MSTNLFIKIIVTAMAVSHNGSMKIIGGPKRALHTRTRGSMRPWLQQHALAQGGRIHMKVPALEQVVCHDTFANDTAEGREKRRIQKRMAAERRPRNHCRYFILAQRFGVI
jgi:hypothetical protein